MIMFIWNELVPTWIKQVIVQSIVIGLALIGAVNLPAEQRLIRSITSAVTHVICQDTVRPSAKKALAAIEASLPKADRPAHAILGRIWCP